MTSPLCQTDFYKVGHIFQYPENTELVFSNLTPRGSRIDNVDEVVFFGLQYYVKRYLIEEWDKNFFDRPKDEVVAEYERRTAGAGLPVTTDHVAALHDLGYLPLEIWALPEGQRVPMRVPVLVMWNTHPDFFWLTNYLETSLSATLWGPCTSATIADQYRTYLENVADLTGGPVEFVPWQGHDFSMRGMYGLEASILSGAAHLLSFNGTDTIAAIDFHEQYYQGHDCDLIGGSVPATEHSVMCAGGKVDELETFRRLITEVYPEGIVSIVSDTWDYWRVLTEHLPALRDQILARDGKVVIRPDSGDPVKVIVGDPDAPVGSPEWKGSFELLEEVFGSTVNDKGFRELNPSIGLIYGDSITFERCQAICEGLIAKGFVPSLVFGIGSFTYQYNTRDTFGFAVKATYAEIGGVAYDIEKDPATDSGLKKSATGLLAVGDTDAGLLLTEQVTWDEVKDCDFEPVFVNGKLAREQSLGEIRSILDKQR
jgi:nicotinamide phosphoribosyltransferase